MNKKNTWEMIVCGEKIVLFAVKITGKILKEIIWELVESRR